jgi:hypothetical protein
MRAGRLFTLWICCGLVALLLGGRLAAPARAAAEVLYVPATGHYMRGVFRDFWDRNGGLANFGYPITEEYVEPGTGRILQYFERARFERALPSSTAVQLGLLGREALGERSFPPAQSIRSSATRRYFPQTGQIVQYGFKETWEGRGGLVVFGLPLSGEITEATDDGVVRTVQYFERARFEYHPDQPPGRRVLLSALGHRFVPAALTAPLAPNAPPPGPLAVTPAQAAPPVEDDLAYQLVPPAVNATIVPLAGGPGQAFTFSPTKGYTAGETVSVWANPLGRAPVFVGRYRADSGGSVAPISFTPPPGAALGQWAIVAEGNDSQRQAIGYFLLISGSVGRLQPTATPTPATPTAAPTAVPPTPTAVPENVDARVTPERGPAGTVFFFDARGFQPGEEVQVAVIDPRGRQSGGEPVRADERGSIRSAGLFYPTAPGAMPGTYTMVAYGRSSNKTSTAYFTVTP